MTRAWGLWAALFLSIVLIVASVGAGYREILPYIAAGSEEASKMAFLARQPEPGLSIEVQRLVLRDCVRLLRPLSGAQLTESDARVRTNCQTFAREVIDQSPVFSFAWYVIALSISLESTGDDFQDALSRSQETTANQWAMASLRLRLAYMYWVDLRPKLREQLGADMLVLVHSSRGLMWLAERYVQDVNFRGPIVENLERAPVNIQQSFLRTVSSLSNNK